MQFATYRGGAGVPGVGVDVCAICPDRTDAASQRRVDAQENLPENGVGAPESGG